MRAQPPSEQVRLYALEAPHGALETPRRARRVIGLIGGAHEEREEKGARQGDGRVDDEGGAANAAHLAKGVFGGAFGGGQIVAEVGLTDPGGAVEVEGEPALDVLLVWSFRCYGDTKYRV